MVKTMGFFPEKSPMSMNNHFKYLLSPGRIGPLVTKNRMVKTSSSLGYQYSETDGRITEKHISFSEAIARGGVGLIITEGGIFDWPLGAHDVFHYRIDNDEYIPGWVELAEAIHKYDCPVFAQMVHSGPWHRTALSGLQPVASSAGIRVEEGNRPDTTRALSVEEIHNIIAKYASAAERYKKAGIDGVEINSSGNHLLNSFLSRGFNKRHDVYGCDTLENRSRIVVEILRAIKQRVGESFPVGILMNAMEYGLENGLTLQETREFARIYEKNGVNYLHVRVDGVGKYLSSHYPELIHYPEPPKPLGAMLDGSRHGAGGYAPLAAAIKQVVKVPVIAVGRLDPVYGEQLLREGKADFIGFTKRLLADPDLPNKVAEGRLEDIAPCTACEHCISFRVYRQPVRCRINAALGSIGEYVIKPAKKKKTVVVVGGGPAGMEAARVAAARGHNVTLYEKESKLGGMLPLAGLVKGFEGEDLMAFTKYFEVQLNKLRVTTHFKKEFTPDVLAQIKPDVVILAEGGKPDYLNIPGINNKNVISGPDLHRTLKYYLKFFNPKILREMTRVWMPVGKRVVIIGGAIQGAELAEFLIKRGKKVTIVAGAESIGEGLPRRKQMRLVEWLTEKGTVIVKEAKPVEVTEKGLMVETKDGQKQMIEAETIVPALPYQPNIDLYRKLKDKVSEVYLIGDGSEPRLILDAVSDGWKTASSI
jgi:2,4-dienoyl-CoA reductase (NADPH2)